MRFNNLRMTGEMALLPFVLALSWLSGCGDPASDWAAFCPTFTEVAQTSTPDQVIRLTNSRWLATGLHRSTKQLIDELSASPPDVWIPLMKEAAEKQGVEFQCPEFERWMELTLLGRAE